MGCTILFISRGELTLPSDSTKISKNLRPTGRQQKLYWKVELCFHSRLHVLSRPGFQTRRVHRLVRPSTQHHTQVRRGRTKIQPPGTKTGRGRATKDQPPATPHVLRKTCGAVVQKLSAIPSVQKKELQRHVFVVGVVDTSTTHFPAFYHLLFERMAGEL